MKQKPRLIPLVEMQDPRSKKSKKKFMPGRVSQKQRRKDLRRKRKRKTVFKQWKKLGFNTYQEYLRSKLWKTIRKAILDRDLGRCEMCLDLANSVHHLSYSEDVLRGKKPESLVSTCTKCHLKCHNMANGRKRSDATAYTLKILYSLNLNSNQRNREIASAFRRRKEENLALARNLSKICAEMFDDNGEILSSHI